MNQYVTILKGLHPGFFLARELHRRKLKKGSFAISIQEYPQTIGAITKGHRNMNTALALKIEQELNLEEGTLMMLQIFFDIEQLKREQQSLRPTLSTFRPALFWDTDINTIDWEKQQRAVIQRVFERGNETEKNEIIRFYGQRRVNENLKFQHA
ncbi:MAG: plasmid maintenance system antidote protein [Bacteroidales bacterium]|nr:plasmid maintenance system antidote protein [Bacteroidales bacterium]